MKGSAKNVDLTPLDELFTTENERAELRREKVRSIPLSELDDFPEHPFRVRDDEEMAKLAESVREHGVLNPVIVRQKEDGRFEILSGHRRRRACELAGVTELPAIVREMSRDEAIVFMVDSNLQREEILPSEKAFSYKMKMEALNRQGKRTDLTSTPLVSKSRTNELVGEASGESREQVRRYIRLTELLPEILDMVDERQMAFRPAVEVSYLTKEEQADLLETMRSEACTPSLTQAIRMKQLSAAGELDMEKIFALLTEEKPNQTAVLKLPEERVSRYWPKDFTPRQKEDLLVELLEKWYRQRQREKER